MRLVQHGCQGEEVALHDARPGEFPAEASLDSARYHCDAVTSQPSVILRATKADFQRSVQRQPDRIKSYFQHEPVCYADWAHLPHAGSIGRDMSSGLVRYHPNGSTIRGLVPMRDRVPERRVALLGLAMSIAVPGLALAAEPMLSLATGSREPLVSSAERPGFVEEVARAALRRIRYELRVVPLPVERALVNANAGIEDGDLYRAAGFEKDYPNLLQVPQPLVDQEFVAFSLRPDVEVQGWPDLARYSVAYVTGNKIIERRLLGFSNVTTVRDNNLLFGLLATGRADVVLINRWVGLWAARQGGLAARLHEPPLLRVPMYIYLHRRHESLIKQLAAALAEVKRDGTWQRLYDQILKPLEAAR